MLRLTYFSDMIQSNIQIHNAQKRKGDNDEAQQSNAKNKSEK